MQTQSQNAIQLKSLQSARTIFRKILSSFEAKDWSGTRTRSIYKKLHYQYYFRKGILDPVDEHYVSQHGTENLLNAPPPNPSLQAIPEFHSVIAETSSARQLFLLLESLQQFYHQPAHFANLEQIKGFEDKYKQRLIAALAEVETLLSQHKS
jgi:hypothetical protein